MEERPERSLKRHFEDSTADKSPKQLKQHCQESCIESRRKNAEKQQKYMERLRTPEKERLEYRQRRNARQKELRHAKRAQELQLTDTETQNNSCKYITEGRTNSQ